MILGATTWTYVGCWRRLGLKKMTAMFVWSCHTRMASLDLSLGSEALKTVWSSCATTCSSTVSSACHPTKNQQQGVYLLRYLRRLVWYGGGSLGVFTLPWHGVVPHLHGHMNPAPYMKTHTFPGAGERKQGRKETFPINSGNWYMLCSGTIQSPFLFYHPLNLTHTGNSCALCF